MKHVLVIPLRFIGDTVLSVPLIRNIARNFPQAQIDVLLSDISAPLLEPCPDVHAVLHEPKSAWRTMQMIHRGHYDAVFILRKSVTMALMCRLAGVKQIIGYDKQRFPFGYRRWGCFLDNKARYPSLKTQTPQAISHLGLLSACGLPVYDDYLELWTTPDDEQRVTQLLAESGIDSEKPLAVVHAVSASHGKTLEIQKYADAVRQLLDEGYQVIATGTAADTPVYQSLDARIINWCGKTSLRETFALYKRIQIIVTVDSSPLHMAAAANVPRIVGVFGPTNEKQWGPHSQTSRFEPVLIDLPCRPCYAKICAHNNCRMTMTAGHIAAAVQNALAN